MTISGSTLRRIEPPLIEPVTLEEAKGQCQIDADLTDDDDDLNRYIKAARERAESYAKRSFVEQTWKLTLRNWPHLCEPFQRWDDAAIDLPNGPILGIVEFSYLSVDGTRTFLDPTQYTLTEDEPAKLIPPFNTPWPTVREYPGSIEIIYRAGYESAGSPVDAENVPEVAKQAILMLVAHWYNNREDSIVGTIVADTPNGFEQTLDQLRTYP